jgi:hypothetical protein
VIGFTTIAQHGHGTAGTFACAWLANVSHLADLV